MLCDICEIVFLFKQKTAYEMRISDWSSDVCSSDLLEFPVLYASGRDGYAGEDQDARQGTLDPLFDLITRHVPSPGLDPSGPFSFLATLLDRATFMGRVLTGRVQSGRITVGDPTPASAVYGNEGERGGATQSI